MRKLGITLSAAAFVLGSMVLSASAQTQSAGAGSMHALKNATPLFTKAACNGYGPYCGPGWIRRCGYWGCRCVPCY